MKYSNLWLTVFLSVYHTGNYQNFHGLYFDKKYTKKEKILYCKKMYIKCLKYERKTKSKK